jgi:cell division transport system ATP-binding protein
MIESLPDNLPIVDMVKVTKVYPPDIVAVQNVSLTVGKGEFVFLTGMSGAGKTTLLKMLCCLEKPNKGVIEVAGYDLSQISPAGVQKLRRQVGVVYQDFKILPKQTVYENIAIPMEVIYRKPKEIRERVDELLEDLRIEHKKNIPTGKLSRGEQQRVAIARAAVNSPPLILADEPTGNLDREISDYVMQLFEKMNKAGSTIIIASHDESIYKQSRHRKVELEHGLFSGHIGHRQLTLIDS